MTDEEFKASIKRGLERAKAQGVQLGRKRGLDHDAIRRLKFMKYSNQAIAEIMGCSASMISNVLTGKRGK